MYELCRVKDYKNDQLINFCHRKGFVVLHDMDSGSCCGLSLEELCDSLETAAPQLMNWAQESFQIVREACLEIKEDIIDCAHHGFNRRNMIIQNRESIKDRIPRHEIGPLPTSGPGNIAPLRDSEPESPPLTLEELVRPNSLKPTKEADQSEHLYKDNPVLADISIPLPHVRDADGMEIDINEETDNSQKTLSDICIERKPEFLVNRKDLNVDEDDSFLTVDLSDIPCVTDEQSLPKKKEKWGSFLWRRRSDKKHDKEEAEEQQQAAASSSNQVLSRRTSKGSDQDLPSLASEYDLPLYGWQLV